MQKKKNFHKTDRKPRTYLHEKLDGTEIEGTIVAHFGAMAEVENASGQVFPAHLRKNAEPCITGDRVLWRLHQGTGIIVSVLPRKSLMMRPENNKKTKLIAANIDLLMIVLSVSSLFSSRFIDRYIIAAEQLRIPSVILLNKVDLWDDKAQFEWTRASAVYEEIGYPVVLSSVFKENGLDALTKLLKNKTGVLMGASGVGKSSIIAGLTQLTGIMIGASSGIHTTTTTRLYHLPEGGALIDSPGVRDFTLWTLSPSEVLQGFVEFHPFLNGCRFRNCQHQSEPGCELRQAVMDGKVSEERWQSYLEVLSQMKQM